MLQALFYRVCNYDLAHLQAEVELEEIMSMGTNRDIWRAGGAAKSCVACLKSFDR